MKKKESYVIKSFKLSAFSPVLLSFVGQRPAVGNKQQQVSGGCLFGCKRKKQNLNKSLLLGFLLGGCTLAQGNMDLPEAPELTFSICF